MAAPGLLATRSILCEDGKRRGRERALERRRRKHGYERHTSVRRKNQVELAMKIFSTCRAMAKECGPSIRLGGDWWSRPRLHPVACTLCAATRHGEPRAPDYDGVGNQTLLPHEPGRLAGDSRGVVRPGVSIAVCPRCFSAPPSASR